MSKFWSAWELSFRRIQIFFSAIVLCQLPNLTHFPLYCSFLHPSDSSNPKLLQWLCKEEIRCADQTMWPFYMWPEIQGNWNWHPPSNYTHGEQCTLKQTIGISLLQLGFSLHVAFPNNFALPFEDFQLTRSLRMGYFGMCNVCPNPPSHTQTHFLLCIFSINLFSAFYNQLFRYNG